MCEFLLPCKYEISVVLSVALRTTSGSFFPLSSEITWQFSFAIPGHLRVVNSHTCSNGFLVIVSRRLGDWDLRLKPTSCGQIIVFRIRYKLKCWTTECDTSKWQPQKMMLVNKRRFKTRLLWWQRAEMTNAVLWVPRVARIECVEQPQRVDSQRSRNIVPGRLAVLLH